MNSESVLPVLFEWFAKSVLITLMAALFARVWRDATAAQRHLIWLVALATVMLLPVTRLVTPRWAIPLQPVTKVSVRLPELPPPPVTNADITSLVEVPAAPPAISPLPDWRKILLGVWLGGAALLLGFRLVGSWRLRRLRHRSVLVDDPRIRILFSRILSELGLHRRSEIRLSEDCRVPVTWGSLRPVMLLPRAALEWNDTWLAAALRHEAAHIRRYDYLTRWLAQLACALYWPNPLVWLLARALRLAQEQAADDLVLRAGTPADEYATQLVDAARAVATHGLFVRQAVAMACPSTLEDRVRAIIDGRRDRRPLSRLAAVCGSLAIALALGISTAAQLRSDEQKPPPAPAAGAPMSPVKSGPRIEIESKFIEITNAPGKAPPPVPEKPAIYSDPQFQVIIRGLSQKKGVDLLAAPRVTTAANQRVTVETIREFRYPAAWEKDGKKWKSTKSDTKKCGVTLDVTPRITDDGAIELHAVATIVEFKGFVDLDNGGKTPAKKKSGTTIESEFPPVPAGHRTEPVFSEQKSENTVTMESDQTVEIFVGEAASVQHVVDGKSAWDETSRRQTFLFISARILNPAPAKKAPKEGAAATTPAPADAKMVLTVDKSGSVKLNGEPISSDDLKTRLQALKTSDAGSSIVVRGDPETPYKTIMDLLDEIQRAGLTNVGIASPAAKAGAVATTPPTFLRNGSNTLTFENKGQTVVAPANTLTLNGATTLTANGGTIDAPAESPAKRADGLVTREWKLPPDMIPAKPGTDGPDRVFAKDWLISKGVIFEDAATAIYIQATSRLIVRNTQAQLDLIDQIIGGGAGAPGAAPAGANQGTLILSGGTLVWKDGTKPDGLTVADTGTLNITGVTTLNVSNDVAKPATAADSPALAKAEKIIIPDFELREATLVDALDALRKQAVEFDPDKTGVKIVLKPGTASDARITVSLHTIPVIEALKYVTALANLEFVVTPEALVVQPVGTERASPEPTPKGTGQQGITVAGGTLVLNGPAPAPANFSGIVTLDAGTTTGVAVDGPALAKAKKIIIPKIELREATLAETLDFLRVRARELDPDKTGVKIVLKPGTVSDAKITLSLTDVPLIEAMKYVAGLANLELVIEPDALTLQPPGGSTSLQAKLGPPAAATERMSITLSAKNPFKGGDGIEIREVTGSASTFQVGGTYRVRGVCRQDAIRNAALYLGVTAEGRGDAIKPAAGTSLSKAVSKGFTEFEFTFIPLRPGKLHVTLYDLDNYDPKDNANGGLYLGDVSP